MQILHGAKRFDGPGVAVTGPQGVVRQRYRLEPNLSMGHFRHHSQRRARDNGYPGTVRGNRNHAQDVAALGRHTGGCRHVKDFRLAGTGDKCFGTVKTPAGCGFGIRFQAALNAGRMRPLPFGDTDRRDPGRIGTRQQALERRLVTGGKGPGRAVGGKTAGQRTIDGEFP